MERRHRQNSGARRAQALVLYGCLWACGTEGEPAPSTVAGDVAGTQTGSDGLGEGDQRYLPSCSDEWVSTDEPLSAPLGGSFDGSVAWGNLMAPTGDVSEARLEVEVLGGLERPAGDVDENCRGVRRALMRIRFELGQESFEEERYQYLASSQAFGSTLEFGTALALPASTPLPVPPIGEFERGDLRVCESSGLAAGGGDAGSAASSEAGAPSSGADVSFRLVPGLGFSSQEGERWGGSLRRECYNAVEHDGRREGWLRVDTVGSISLERPR